MAKILVVDDDASVRASFEQLLLQAGHQVFLSSDGRDGIRQHRASPMDLVIIDLFMPDQDGLETITQLHREFPSLVIIAISGGYAASATMLSVAEELGAARVLEKPFDSKLLLLSVEELLQVA